MPSVDTKEKILECAEKLFAEKGLGATSLRSIIKKAGVNIAAAHYHFGSKDDLIIETFKRRLEPLNAERLKLLDELEARHGEAAVPVKDIMDAFIRPAISFCQDEKRGGQSFMRLMGRAHIETSEKLREHIVDQFGEVIARFIKALKKALPELSIEELAWRFTFCVGAMAFSLVGGVKHEKFAALLGTTMDTDALCKHLVYFVSSGLNASPNSGDVA